MNNNFENLQKIESKISKTLRCVVAKNDLDYVAYALA